MSQRQPNGLAWTLLALTVVLLAANAALGLTGGEAWSGVFGFIPVTLSFALVGALIAVRAGNRLGWFFLAGATVTALSVAATTYAARTLDEPRFRAAARRMAATLAAERDDGLVVGELERATLSHPDPRDPSRR